MNFSVLTARANEMIDEVLMSASGTNRTSWHVRSMVAIGGKADIAGTARFGSD